MSVGSRLRGATGQTLTSMVAIYVPETSLV